MGVNNILGIIILCVYCTCAVIRLAFFNVLEGNRQKTESGANKTYRGLPVTSISIILPLIYPVKFFCSPLSFLIVLHVFMALVSFLFVLDFKIKKPNLFKLFIKK